MIDCRACGARKGRGMVAVSTHRPRSTAAWQSGVARIRWYVCRTCKHREKTVEMIVYPGTKKRTTEAEAVSSATKSAQRTIRETIMRSAIDEMRRALKAYDQAEAMPS